MKRCLKSGLLFGLSVLSLNVACAADTGNRYGYPVLYHSEISSAEAWLQVKQNQSKKPTKKHVILDVRRIEEYVKGHPPGAYSIPFPHITKSPTKENDNTSGYIGYDITVDPDVNIANVDKDGALNIQAFVDYVKSKFPDINQPLYLVCATGHRSVQAANALVKYGGYKHVRNVWEGYTGQLKYAYTGDKPTEPFVALDLNNDGKLDDKDKDGWAFYQGLPIETKLKKSRLFEPYLPLYYSSTE